MFADLQAKAKEHSATCVATSQWVQAKSQSAKDFNNSKRTTVAQSGKEVEDMAKSNFVLYPDANSFAPIASTTKGCIVDLTLLMDALAADLAAAPGRLPIQPSAMDSMKASAEAAWETLIATGYERLTDTAKVFCARARSLLPFHQGHFTKGGPRHCGKRNLELQWESSNPVFGCESCVVLQGDACIWQSHFGARARE